MYFLLGVYTNTGISRTTLRPFADQDCQIFLDTIYQSEEKYTKLPNGHKIYQMVVK
jgi:hypothetical protein